MACWCLHGQIHSNKPGSTHSVLLHAWESVTTAEPDSCGGSPACTRETHHWHSAKSICRSAKQRRPAGQRGDSPRQAHGSTLVVAPALVRQLMTRTELQPAVGQRSRWCVKLRCQRTALLRLQKAGNSAEGWGAAHLVLLVAHASHRAFCPYQRACRPASTAEPALAGQAWWACPWLQGRSLFPRYPVPVPGTQYPVPSTQYPGEEYCRISHNRASRPHFTTVGAVDPASVKPSVALDERREHSRWSPVTSEAAGVGVALPLDRLLEPAWGRARQVGHPPWFSSQ